MPWDGLHIFLCPPWLQTWWHFHRHFILYSIYYSWFGTAHRPNNWKDRALRSRALNLFLILITPTHSHQDWGSIGWISLNKLLFSLTFSKSVIIFPTFCPHSKTPPNRHLVSGLSPKCFCFVLAWLYLVKINYQNYILWYRWILWALSKF